MFKETNNISTSKYQIVNLQWVESISKAENKWKAASIAILAQQGDLQHVLQMGIACGSATTMAEGTGLFAKKDVDRLFSEIKKR